MEYEGELYDSHDNSVATVAGNGDKKSQDHFSTLPMKQKLNSTRNQTSFTSISSSESGFDTVDAIPLRIQRMPLLGEDYIQKRQASVENLLSNKTPTQSSRYSRHDDLINETDSLKELHHKSTKDNPDPYSYFEIQKNEYPNFLDGHTKSSTLLQKNSDVILRQRSMSDSDHSEGAFKNGTANSCPKNSTNRSVPNLDDQRDSADVEKIYGYTETDLVATRQPKPILKEGVEEEAPGEKSNEPVNVEPVSTPPRNISNGRRVVAENESLSSCGICTSVCCALVHWKHQFDRFSAVDITLTIASITIFIFDVITDLTVAARYYSRIETDERYRFYAGLTFGLVIGPSIIIQIFSYLWVIDDFRSVQKRKREIKKEYVLKPRHVMKLILFLIVHIFQLAVLFRYIRALIYGFRSRYYGCMKKEKHREHYETLWRYEVHDINMLRLLESFLESAPQLVLQLYIMLMTKHVDPFTVVSCILSLLALSTMMVAIQRAIRNSNEEKKQLSICASIVMFCWRACTISSRVLAFGLFLTIQPLAFLFFIIAHWMAATIWIAVRGTKFCTKKILEYLFDGVCGLIYIFCFFNVHEEKNGKKSRSRLRMLVFYSVVFAENCVLSILWYFFRPGSDSVLPSPEPDVSGILSSTTKQTVIERPDLIPTKSAGIIQSAPALAMLFAVVGFFIVGLVFMLIYYTLLHPTKSSNVCCCVSPKRGTGENSGTTLVSAPARSYTSVPTNDTAPIPAGLVLMSSNTVRETPGRQSLSESENSDVEPPLQAMWSETVFNRGKRAKKLYSRQYSREKVLDENEDVTRSHDDIISRYSPRRTDRYKTVVTPTQNVNRSPIRWIDPAKSNVSKSVSSEKTQITKLSSVSNTEELHTPSSQFTETLTPKSCDLSTRSNEPENTTPQTEILKKSFQKSDIAKNSAIATYSHSSSVKEFRPKASVVIKPGSQTLKPMSTPRSATHQALQSHTLLSPKKSNLNPSTSLQSSPSKHSYNFPAKKVPQPVEGRDYSASMSCLMGDKPLSYAARRRRALNPDVPRTSSFTIKPCEVIECMESSV